MSAPGHGVPSGEWFLLRPRRCVWASAGLLALVGITASVLPTQPTELEQRWADAMRATRSSLFEHVALVFNALGRGVGVAVTVGSLAAVLVIRRRWFALACFLIVEGAAQVASSLLKVLVGRPRPPDGLVDPVGSSFPSGHTTYATATCIACVLLFTSPNGNRRLAWVSAAIGATAMAWSRTYLQVHWLYDVIGGAMLGAGIALGSFAAAQLLRRESGQDLHPESRELLACGLHERLSADSKDENAQ